jgi:rhodanese-related sulfurtransferase
LKAYCCCRRRIDPACRKSLSQPNTLQTPDRCGIAQLEGGSVKIGTLGQFGIGANSKNICYRLADKAVADLWVQIYTLAEERLIELQLALQKIAAQPNDLVPSDRESLIKAARKGEVVALDVRPSEEYLTAHLPFARSIPLEELRKRLGELPKDRSIVAYCRGPYCLMAVDAVALLKGEGYSAIHLREGVAEWAVANQ